MNKPRGSNQSGAPQGLLPSKVSPPVSPPLPPVSPEGKAKVDMLLLQVDALSIMEDSNHFHRQLHVLQEACVLACSDADTLKYAVERLHRICLKERSMCAKVAILSNAVSSLEVEGLRFRSLLLNCLQEDYEARQSMQADDPQKFLNAAALLCEAFTRIRSHDTPITVLSKPVLEYLEALLSGDEQEIELFANLVALTGNDLHTVANCGFQKILFKVRDTLKSRNLSSQCRLWLLLIMDISYKFFDPSFSNIMDFYKEHLGPGASELMKVLKTSHQDSIDHNILEKTSDTLPENNVSEKLSEMKVTHSSTVKAEKSLEISSMAPANETDKRKSFRAALNIGSSKKGTFWGHDDRFEKDDIQSKTAPNTSRQTSSSSNWRQHSVNKVGRENFSSKTPKDQYNKNYNGEKDSWRKASSTVAFTPVHVECEENWDD